MQQFSAGTNAASIVVSIVVYRSDETWFRQTIDTLIVSLRQALTANCLKTAHVVVVDNDPSATSNHVAHMLDEVFADAVPNLTRSLIKTAKNIGYGAANNLALLDQNTHDNKAEFVLVLNPDVALARGAVTAAILHFNGQRKCAMVTPVATFADGTPQYLVKGPPSVFTLALRGFAPEWLRSLFATRLAAYDRMDIAFDAPLNGAEFVSGCCMFMRGDVWRDVGGFDKNFFLYFEDFDLSKRIAAIARIDRVPACAIVHAGGNAATKGGRHIGLFIRSAVRFFARHGWRIL